MKTSEAVERLSSRIEGDYDPPPTERVYFTSNTDGQRGWMVRRAGGLAIKIDRTGEDKWIKYRKGDWSEILEDRPLTPMRVAFVAYEADRALCSTLNIVLQAKRSWESLTPELRKKFMENGPQSVITVRNDLWRDITERLKPLTK